MKLQKITQLPDGSPKRWYEDACATAHALEQLGERWALLVMRELMFGAKRFGDLKAGLPGISAAVLTQRLAGLESAGVVVRRKLPPPASVQVYELTAWGLESEPIFAALGRWAARSPTHDSTLPFSAASLLLSLRTMLDAERARGLDLSIGLRLGAESFVARLARGRITIARAETGPADLVFTGSASAVAAAIYGGQSFAELEDAGALRVDGDRAKAQTFIGLFPLPTKASVQASGQQVSIAD